MQTTPPGGVHLGLAKVPSNKASANYLAFQRALSACSMQRHLHRTWWPRWLENEQNTRYDTLGHATTIMQLAAATTPIPWCPALRYQASVPPTLARALLGYVFWPISARCVRVCVHSAGWRLVSGFCTGSPFISRPNKMCPNRST